MKRKLSWVINWANKWNLDRQIIARKIQLVFGSAFENKTNWPLEKIENRVANATVLAALCSSDDPTEDWLGYALYYLPDEKIFGSKLLWESSIAITLEIHGRGYASFATEKVLSFVNEDVQWLACRTQSPMMIRRYRRLGNLVVQPHHTARFREFVLKYIPDLQNADVSENGIVKCAYKDGSLTNLQDPGNELALYEGVGFDRSNGDAILLIARLNMKLHAASACDKGDNMNPERRIELFWNEYINHNEWQRHNENQRASLSNILLIISAAIVTYLSQQLPLSGNLIPLISFLTGIGLLGVVAVLKYWERFKYHVRHEEALREVIDDLLRIETCSNQNNSQNQPTLASTRKIAATAHAKGLFPLFRDPFLRQHWIWIGIFVFISVLGFCLLVQCLG